MKWPARRGRIHFFGFLLGISHQQLVELDEGMQGGADNSSDAADSRDVWG
jgi:hypothetical protein